MQATELRELQASVRQQYSEYPECAVIPTHAEGVVDMETLTCKLAPRENSRIAGLQPATGGSGEFACSADLLLDALVGCAGVTFAAVASARSLDIRSARIIADGHWDARGTLGADRSAPVGLTDVTLTFDIDSDMDAETRQRLISVVERYCVVAQTLVHPPRFSVLDAVDIN